MNRISRILFSAFFTGALLLQSGKAQSGPEQSAGTQSSAAAMEQATYSQGTKAMDEQRWSDAVAAFDRVAAAKGERSDAGLYWKAYSLNKLGRKDEARATCDILDKQQPSSRWNFECRALEARSAIKTAGPSQLFEQMQSAEQQTAIAERQMAATEQQMAVAEQQLNNFKIEMPAMDIQRTPFRAQVGGGFFPQKNHPADEDDIKIIALNSLMRQDPEKALPLLQTLLKSNKPVAMRQQALFVLSRSSDPQAQAILTEAATTRSEPQLQSAAVQYLSLSHGKDVGPTLVKVYRESADAKVKRAAINGLFLTHDAPALVDLARGEKDLNLKLDIVSQLSLMKDKAATDYMLELLK